MRGAGKFPKIKTKTINERQIFFAVPGIKPSAMGWEMGTSRFNISKKNQLDLVNRYFFSYRVHMISGLSPTCCQPRYAEMHPGYAR